MPEVPAQRPTRIMVVDDTPANLRLLDNVLRERGYQVYAFRSGELALNAARRNAPDLILLDVNMPDMNGYEVCEKLKEVPGLRDVPVIFISAMHETMDKVRAFKMGGVDYVSKPFQVEEVEARVQTHLNLHRLQCELAEHNLRLQELVSAQVREITSAQMAIIFAMAKMSESRDDETGLHSERMRWFCSLLAEELKPHYPHQVGADFIDLIYHASPLHDIGKVATPDAILQKPGKLTPEEYKIMQQHTILGAQTLDAVGRQYPNNAFLTMGVAIARWHHERWNGSGYPDGLAGENIPLSARIMAVADVYDALRSRRRYKEAYSHAVSCEIINQEYGSHFDPKVVDAFQRVAVEFARIHQDSIEQQA
jgi:putative two-component system response regulator